MLHNISANMQLSGLTSWVLLNLRETITLHNHYMVNQTKSGSSQIIFFSTHLLIVFATSHLTWSSCFICRNKEFLFLKVLLSCTIILSVLQYVDTFLNLVSFLHMTSLTSLAYQILTAELSCSFQSYR